jgi:pSer/pThr/pTyr-binding forkhead associated (FHA) protein
VSTALPPGAGMSDRALFLFDEVVFMKVQLVVSGGVHEGKSIPIATSQFLIGRDPHCNLRPASAAVSKQHCGIFQRDGKVFVRDYGSTNGTSVNGVSIDGEREVVDGDKLKAGPLEFTVRIEAMPQTTVVAPQAKKTATAKEPAKAAPVESTVVNSDDAAAMLMAMDDDAPTAGDQIPDGTTAIDLPAAPDGTAEPKPPPKPTAPVNSSKAAADILSKYMRRPRT